MKTIKTGSLIKFEYAGSKESRYVNVTNISPKGFGGGDITKGNDDNKGYRTFLTSKVDLDTLEEIATPDQFVLPNTCETVGTILMYVGLSDEVIYNKDEDVFILNKSLVAP